MGICVCVCEGRRVGHLNGYLCVEEGASDEGR